MFLRKLMSLVMVLGLVAVLPVGVAGCDVLNINIPGGNTNDNDDNSNDNDSVDARFARFTDPADETFSTPDVRDVNDEIVRFDTEVMSLVRVSDETEYQEGLWTVNGNLLGSGAFQVRFGTVGGEKRAYFTETGPGTICRFQFTATSFQIFPTTQTPPQN